MKQPTKTHGEMTNFRPANHKTSMFNVVPKHVAIIMDGNGRWATQRGKNRIKGHQVGASNIKSVIKTFYAYGVSYITIYAFSTENWSRPQKEISNLFTLLVSTIENEIDDISRLGIKVIHIGEKKNLQKQILNAFRKAENKTSSNKTKTLAVGFNYGGRAELLHMTKQIIGAKLKHSEITAEKAMEYLYAQSMPNVDLVIRTGGENRLSNFLIWQTVNARFISTETLWPDFNSDNVKKVLQEFNDKRNL